MVGHTVLLVQSVGPDYGEIEGALMAGIDDTLRFEVGSGAAVCTKNRDHTALQR